MFTNKLEQLVARLASSRKQEGQGLVEYAVILMLGALGAAILRYL